MAEFFKKIMLSILNNLGKKFFIFHKAAKILSNYGWKNFFSRTKFFLLSKFNSKKYEWENPVNLKTEFTKLSDREYTECDETPQTPTMVFTIVSKNYMQYALTLRESYLKSTNNSEFTIVLMDMLRNKDEVNLFEELISKGIKILGLHEVKNGIGNINIEAMLFKYDILEMNTAIKPFFLEYFCNLGYENVIYIDPDIYFTDSLQPLINKLAQNDIILTPHALCPYPDEKSPDDLAILRAGTFNLGFIAIRNTKNSLKMCRWWQDKLFDLCINDLEKGLFVDQKWMDLVPSFFDKVYIERAAAYNVAYWNLHERKLHKKNENWYVNGERLIFFHFSGMPIDDINCISKHQTRYTLESFSELKPLFSLYRDEVLKNGYHVFRKICGEYYFGYIPGTTIKIPDIIRRAWYKEILSEVNNPYLPSFQSINTLIRLIKQNDAGVNRIAKAIYDKRQDLKDYFGDIKNSTSRISFNRWFKQSAKKEYKIDDCLLESEHISLNQNSKEIFKEGVGINLISYFENMVGTAEVSRATVKRLYSTGIPFSLFLLKSEAHSILPKKESEEFLKYCSETPVFGTNIFFINADSIPSLHEYYGHLFENHYNIAVWWWEFDDYFQFNGAFQFVDEVVVMTDFIKTAIKKVLPSDVKLTKITYPFIKNWEIIASKDGIRNKYNIGKNDYVYFFNFDFFSSYERKNPELLIRAFIEVCRNKKDVKLVLKTIHGDTDTSNRNKIKKIIEDNNIAGQVVMIDEALSRNELITIVNSIDCYVSLHRSEGLGLGMMEAMYLGKPVIGTGFGGNLDFMTKENSLIVDYTLVPVKENFGPYKQGWLWAEPNIEQAISYMEEVYYNRELAETLGKVAAKFIRDQYSIHKFQKDILKLVR